MKISTTIYWFSGTGNSLYVAKRLTAGLGGASIVSMASGVPVEAVGGDGEKLGFVFPSYYCNLPRIVRAFAENLKIRDRTYLFAIVTMGGLGQGSIAELESLLKKKNLELSYGRGIHTPANYIIRYNPADKAKMEGKLNKVNEKIKFISSQINFGVRSVKKIRLSTNYLYKNIENLDSQFYAENTCASCGQCAKLCPAANIKIDNGKPLWLHHCEHCVACISWCPKEAIQYGGQTKTRRRYRNPKISANEMITAMKLPN
ncbi:MAG: EFR1 family ferrodoxin [Treponema sp.]|jgi:formate hydrogenlyase subunit 6/NADH:ubiquinone oxidoreductase subunit I|nr:EFR1 family ferrodoxin [Treponema sp.]